MSSEIVFQDKGEIKEFEIVRPSVYVAVFFYPNSDQPWAASGPDKAQLLRSMHDWYGLDKSRPVLIYTITP
jgi:hypothetical protein